MICDVLFIYALLTLLTTALSQTTASVIYASINQFVINNCYVLILVLYIITTHT